MDDEPGVPEVRPPTLEDLRRICRALEEAGARYVLIGGFAVICHGGERTTKDIDLLVDPAPENVARPKRALSVLEDDAAREIGPRDLETYTVVRVADEVMVALLAAACGVTWSEARPTAETVDLAGRPVVVADRATLIRTKQTARPRTPPTGPGWSRCRTAAEARPGLLPRAQPSARTTRSRRRASPSDQAWKGQPRGR